MLPELYVTLPDPVEENDGEYECGYACKMEESAEREFLCKLSSIYAEYEKRLKEIDKM